MLGVTSEYVGACLSYNVPRHESKSGWFQIQECRFGRLPASARMNIRIEIS